MLTSTYYLESSEKFSNKKNAQAAAYCVECVQFQLPIKKSVGLISNLLTDCQMTESFAKPENVSRNPINWRNDIILDL